MEWSFLIFIISLFRNFYFSFEIMILEFRWQWNDDFYFHFILFRDS